MPDSAVAPTSDAPGAALRESQAALVSAEAIANALKTSELQYRRLFEAARDGILILDSDQGKITDANPFMTELLGYSHDELLGKQLWEIGLLQDKTAGQAAFQLLKQNGYIRYEDLPLENQRGERREVEFVSNLYLENGHTVIQCNIRDITERKQVAIELAAVARTAAKHGRQAAVLKERTRLAQEIHDTLAQGFTRIITQLEAAEAALVSEKIQSETMQLEKVQLRIGKARDLARESLAEARRSVAALRSSPLEEDSLSETLARFLAQRTASTAVRGHYLLEGIPRDLPVSLKHCLLRIGQEAIANAVDHAQAQTLEVTLSFDTLPFEAGHAAAGQVRLRVRDDGQGFDTQQLHAGRFGIIGMQERAAQVRGTLTISSQLGQGTEVEFGVPVFQGTYLPETYAEGDYDL